VTHLDLFVTKNKLNDIGGQNSQLLLCFTEYKARNFDKKHGV